MAGRIGEPCGVGPALGRRPPIGGMHRKIPRGGDILCVRVQIFGLGVEILGLGVPADLGTGSGARAKPETGDRTGKVCSRAVGRCFELSIAA